MIRFTAGAKEKVLGFMNGAKEGEQLMLRIAISGEGPSGYTYDFFLDERKNQRPEDFILDEDGFTTAVDGKSLEKMVGSTVDWKETVNGSGFDVENPNRPTPAPSLPELDSGNPLVQRVQEVLSSKVNPAVASHGGMVSLVAVEENQVFLKLGGGCQGCGMVDVTLKQGIEVMIKEAVPEIAGVIDITEHADGKNPYYQPSK